MSTDEKKTVLQDIEQEAIRRIAENKRKVEEAREKVILAHIQKLEYDALPKCAHGVPNDAKALNDYYEHYDAHIYTYERTRFKTMMLAVLESRGAEAVAETAAKWPRLVACDKCTQEAHVKKQKEEAKHVSELCAEVVQRVTVKAAEQVRLYEIDRSKKIEERTTQLKNNKTILNFVGLDRACRVEIYYLQGGGGKYVPIVDGVEEDVKRVLWSEPGGDFVQVRPTPAQWSTHFIDGLIPFLPVCPCCAKPTQMYAAADNPHSAPLYIGSVVCAEFDNASTKFIHYKWEASTGKHYKNGVVWDPLDPDGVKAAAEAQMVELQAKIQRLRVETV